MGAWTHWQKKATGRRSNQLSLPSNHKSIARLKSPSPLTVTITVSALTAFVYLPIERVSVEQCNANSSCTCQRERSLKLCYSHCLILELKLCRSNCSRRARDLSVRDFETNCQLHRIALVYIFRLLVMHWKAVYNSFVLNNTQKLRMKTKWSVVH